MHTISVILFLLVLVSATYAIPAPVCPASSSSTGPGVLRTDLLCDYENTIRPVKDHLNATVISFGLLLKYFNYDHFTHTLSIDAWVITKWNDQHMKWNPVNYDNIKSIHINSYELWVPDLSIYNRKDQSTDPGVISSVTCSVSYTGSVQCIPPLHADVLCVADLRKYPYDIQNCTLGLGSWVYNGEELKLSVLKPAVTTDDLVSNGEWELVTTEIIEHAGIYECCPNISYPTVDIVLQLRRHSVAHAASVIIPLIVGILLNITSLIMSPLNNDRLILCFINFLGQSLHVQHIAFMVPLNGENIPSVVNHTRDALLLTGISIIATIFLKFLMGSTRMVPPWVSGIVASVITSKPGQFVLLPDSTFKGAVKIENNEDTETILSNSESSTNKGDWVMLGKILDILLLLSYIIIYFVMLITF